MSDILTTALIAGLPALVAAVATLIAAIKGNDLVKKAHEESTIRFQNQTEKIEQQTHIINSRLDELIAAKEVLAKAAGVLEERNRVQLREGKPSGS